MTFASHRRALTSALMLAMLVATRAHAQDAAKDTVKHWAFTGNLGLAIVSGNTSLTTITAGDELTWHSGPWKVKQVLGLIYGKNDSVETANQLFFGLRGDYQFASRWGLYLGARFDRNKFAGFTSRYGENAGVIWNAVVAPKDKLDLEAGLGLTQQQNTDATSENFPNGRGALVYRHSWKEKTYFQEAVEVLPDLKDSQNLRVNSLLELVAPISSGVGMRLAYLVQYDRQPQPTFKTTDQTLSAGMQFSF
jgi:putative salt-induced outer membrane protein